MVYLKLPFASGLVLETGLTAGFTVDWPLTGAGFGALVPLPIVPNTGRGIAAGKYNLCYCMTK